VSLNEECPQGSSRAQGNAPPSHPCPQTQRSRGEPQGEVVRKVGVGRASITRRPDASARTEGGPRANAQEEGGVRGGTGTPAAVRAGEAGSAGSRPNTSTGRGGAAPGGHDSKPDSN
jgi:hypothetical protein